MKPRLLHNLILALVVAGLATFLLLKPQQAGPQKYRLSDLQPDAVSRITLQPANRAPIVLEKHGKDWRMTAPFTARADAIRAAGALEILQAQSETRLPAIDAAQFELDKPFVRMTVRQGNTEREFVFGGRQPVSNEVYVASDKQVYLVPPTFLMDVARLPGDYVSRKPLAEGESLLGFVLPGLKLILKDGQWQREPNDSKLGADQLNRFADEWRLALATGVDKASKAKPLQRMQILLADGKALDFSLIAREPEVILRREDEGLEYRFPRDVGERLLNPAAPPQP